MDSQKGLVENVEDNIKEQETDLIQSKNIERLQ